jgi:hypothetical protein
MRFGVDNKQWAPDLSRPAVFRSSLSFPLPRSARLQLLARSRSRSCSLFSRP